MPEVTAVDRAPHAIDEGGHADELELVLRRVRAYARRRAAWLRHLWAREGTPSPGLVTHDEIDTVLDDLDAPEAEAAWQATAPEARALNAAIAAIEDERADLVREGGRLVRLWDAFGLEQHDVDLVDLLLAVELDPGLARVCAYLQDDATLRYPTLALASRLFGPGRGALGRGSFGLGTALTRWRVVTEHPQRPGDLAALSLDPAVLRWLTTGEAPPPVRRGSPLSSWPVEETVAWVRDALDRGMRVRIAVSGLPGSGRRTFAAECSAQVGRALFVGGASHDAPHETRSVASLAALEGGAIAWLSAPAGDMPGPALEWVILASGEASPAAPAGTLERVVSLPVPSVSEREHLWRALVPGAEHWPAEERRSLAARFRTLPGEIAAIARRSPADPRAAEEAVRAAGRAHLGALAEVVECPFGWDDLVVSEVAREQLRELQFVAQARPQLWERPEARRLFPGGRGLLALFSGPPGTGKTMASQVVAASLGVDLVRVDLSQVISKYVGETSQNLDRILRQAERLDVVLLFDEADAIFGRRTEVKDAHDRYANTDTAYLLQAIEGYPGLAVLATNRKADIDPAFLRRFRFIVEFEKPGAEERTVMWERLVSELAGAEAWACLGADVAPIAAGVEATGAQIKFAVLSALLLAERDGKPIEASHLLRGLARELQKDGRPFGQREQERLVRWGQHRAR